MEISEEFAKHHYLDSAIKVVNMIQDALLRVHARNAIFMAR